MKMKKSIFALTLAASLGLAACNNSEDEVVISSEVGDITKEELYNEMKANYGTQQVQQLMYQRILENEFKIEEKDVQAKFDTEKEQYGEAFDMVLAQQGLTQETYKSQMKIQMLEEQLLTSLEVKDEEIKAYYDQSGKELHARHILVDDEKTANEVIKKLNDGGDFAALAKEYSTEPGAETSGGDLGWFGIGKMVQPFFDAAFAMKKDEISAPVKTDFGYHVIQLLDTRDVEGFGTFDEMKDSIKESLTNQKANEKVVQLIKDAKLDVKDTDLTGVFSGILETKEDTTEKEEK